MFHVLQRKLMDAGSATSRLKFEADLGAVQIGQRYLLLDGKRAYNLGINCQTCATLFQRLPGANQSLKIGEAVEALRSVVDSLSEDVVSIVSLGLPEDEYFGALADASLLLVQPGDVNDYFAVEEMALWGEDTFWCLPHDPRVPYFRTGEKDMGDRRKLFNFIVPMYPTKWPAFKTISDYMKEQETRGTGTAVAISVLDVKGPSDWVGDEPRGPLSIGASLTTCSMAITNCTRHICPENPYAFSLLSHFHKEYRRENRSKKCSGSCLIRHESLRVPEKSLCG